MWHSRSSHPPISAAALALSEDVVIQQRTSQMQFDPHSSSVPYFALPVVSGLGGCVNQPRSRDHMRHFPSSWRSLSSDFGRSEGAEI